MWSGQFVHLTQAWNNYKCLDPNATTWMDVLGKNGYHTHSMGKLDYTSGDHSVRWHLCRPKNVFGHMFYKMIKQYIWRQNVFEHFLVHLWLLRISINACLLFSNRVEAWTRDVPFLLRQEGRPVTELVGDLSTKRVMTKDWNITDAAVQWVRHTAASLAQPFALYLGLNLPHPYRTDSLGPTAGGSTFRTSPYWLNKVSCLSCFAWYNGGMDNV